MGPRVELSGIGGTKWKRWKEASGGLKLQAANTCREGCPGALHRGSRCIAVDWGSSTYERKDSTGRGSNSKPSVDSMDSIRLFLSPPSVSLFTDPAMSDCER